MNIIMGRNPEVDEVRAETKGGGTLPPSHTSGFTWRTIITAVALIVAAVVAVVYGLPLFFPR
jgi:hypothetical protein